MNDFGGRSPSTPFGSHPPLPSKADQQTCPIPTNRLRKPRPCHLICVCAQLHYYWKRVPSFPKEAMYVLTLLIVLSGICNGYRLWNMLGGQRAVFPRHSSTMLPMRRLFRRGTHETTEEEEKVHVVIPVVRQRVANSDPCIRLGKDGKRIITTRPDWHELAADNSRSQTKKKAKSDPMDYAKTKMDSDSSWSTLYEEEDDSGSSGSDGESSPSKHGGSRSASSRSPSKSKNSHKMISLSRAGSAGIKRATSDHATKPSSGTFDAKDIKLNKSNGLPRVTSSDNLNLLRISPSKSAFRNKTLPTRFVSSKQVDGLVSPRGPSKQLKSSTELYSRHASQESISISRETSMLASVSVEESKEESKVRQSKRRGLLDSPSISHATEASESNNELRFTRDDIPRSKSETNELVPKDIRAKSENSMVRRAVSGQEAERPYRSTSDSTTDTTAQVHTIQTGNAVLAS